MRKTVIKQKRFANKCEIWINDTIDILETLHLYKAANGLYKFKGMIVSLIDSGDSNYRLYNQIKEFRRKNK